MPYVCAVESTFGVRLPDEVRAAEEQLPTYRGRGQPRKPRPAPLYSVKELIDAQPASAWQTIEWREGTKGTMRTQVVAIRVHWATGSPRHSCVHTGPVGWLLAERPVPAPKRQEPSTDEPVPPDDFQGRRWDGLHRHLALVMLAYSFLMLQRLLLPLPAGEAFPPLSHT